MLLSRKRFLWGSLMIPLLSRNILPSPSSENKPSMTGSKQFLAKIISGGESVPRIGLGTYQTFDAIGREDIIQELEKVMLRFYEWGGRMVDSSPMYGSSEEVLGNVSQTLGINSQLFLATKVWIRGKKEGENQMTSSLSKMKRKHLELMQIHNLVDWKTQLTTIKDWKEKGKIKYIGITHYTPSAFPELEAVLKSEKIDFLQIPYSIAETEADNRLIPIAYDKGVTVIANEPFDKGNLFRKTKGKHLPEFAKEIGINTWAEYFLKFILASEKVQFVIPATSKLSHLEENMQAGLGNLPNAKERERMKKEFSSF